MSLPYHPEAGIRRPIPPLESRPDFCSTVIGSAAMPSIFSTGFFLAAKMARTTGMRGTFSGILVMDSTALPENSELSGPVFMNLRQPSTGLHPRLIWLTWEINGVSSMPARMPCTSAPVHICGLLAGQHQIHVPHLFDGHFQDSRRSRTGRPNRPSPDEAHHRPWQWLFSIRQCHRWLPYEMMLSWAPFFSFSWTAVSMAFSS